MQEENHLFQGLKRDNHQIRQESSFLWNAHNIRLTNRDDSTLLSITNERGTSNPLTEYKGRYVGHCVVGKYLVVFTAEDSTSYIYRTETSEDSYHTVILFNRDLGLSSDNPIQTLGVVESNLINKVYWIDSKHQPRFINITKPELKGLPNMEDYTEYYEKDHFDFVCSLQLKETVEVRKIHGSGLFAPGVIQYACTYYNKYGQESNIFFTTPIQYISFKDRAGGPEDRVSNSFELSIKNIDTSFDYLRIYSIHRTSIDAVPEVKQLPDISLDNLDTLKPLKVIDTGTEGSIADPTKLLYIGGRDIIAKCMTTKDNTLFFGNIELNNADSDFRDYIDKHVGEITLEKDIPIYDTAIPENFKDTSTYYLNNTRLDEGYNAGFKANESYRIGIQAQLSNGTWTPPVYLFDDVLTDKYPTITYGEKNLPERLIQYSAEVKIPTDVVRDLKGKVKKVRLCGVFPRAFERDVICQGILNPTVYNGVSRSQNAPFVQASWFFRPSMVGEFKPAVGGAFGGNIEFRHNQSLATYHSGAEIQSMRVSGAIDSFRSPARDTTNFYIDNNIITLNSPDIEFDANLMHITWDNTKLKILGYIELDSIYGDMSLQTSTPRVAPGAAGFKSGITGYPSDVQDEFRTNGGLVTIPAYEDGVLNDKHETVSRLELYQVYPFHRTGSLNNDINREDNSARSSVLSKKIISNLKFFNKFTDITLTDGTKHPIMDIDTPQIFSSNEVSILKMKVGYLYRTLDDVYIDATYQGNVDTLLSPNEEYLIHGNGFQGVSFNASKEPIRMKYKSSPHIVFQLLSPESRDRNTQTLLPRHINTPTPGGLHPNETIYPDWIIKSSPYDKATDAEIFESNEAYSGLISRMGYDFYNSKEGPIPGKDEMVDYKGDKNIYARYIDALGNEIRGVGNIELTGTTDGSTSGTIYEFKLNDPDKIYEIEPGTTIKIGEVFTESMLGDLYLEDEYTRTENEVVTKVSKYVLVDSLGGLIIPSRPTGGTASGSIGTAPHRVFHIQSTFGSEADKIKPYLLLAELIREQDPNTKFGGKSEQALMSNLWIPISDPKSLDEVNNTGELSLLCKYGDTWYSRYDCLKTYPFTKEDINQIVEIGSFMCETRVNLDGRWDRNKGNLSNLQASPENFNLLNEVYTQKDNFFNYRILDKDHYKNSKFSNQITWSLEKVPVNEVDLWTNVNVANTLDLDGEKDEITALVTWNEQLLCFQKKALNQILFNNRVQIPTSDGVPIEISNGYKVDGSRVFSSNIGCDDKNSIITTPQGVYFIDSNTDAIYLFNGQLTNLSDSKGMNWWVKQGNIKNVWKPISYNYQALNGIRAFYDSKYGDVYFTPGPTDAEIQPDALCYSEKLGQFVSLMSYGGTQAMFNFADGFYSLRRDNNNLKLYQNNVGEYNNFYGEYKGWDFSFISNENPTYTKIFDTIELRADHYQTYNTEELLNDCPMTFIKVSNEYQQADDTLDNKNMRKKFRVWRGTIPRNNGTRQRIRNPWAMITLGWTPYKDYPEYNTRKAVIHDVSVKYTV